MNCDEELIHLKNWLIEDEVNLLYSTLDNKPVGIDKHFQMSVVWNHFTSRTRKNTSSESLWQKLGAWYNLKSLDEFEVIPFDVYEEDFQLPAEIFPESFLKPLTDEEKKNVDVSGVDKKYFTLSELADDDKSQFKLKGHEKLKWFEHPPVSKTNKHKLKDDFPSETFETKKVIRQYGKAGEVSSGSLLTVPVPPLSLFEEDDNFTEIDLPVREESSDSKKTTTSAKNDKSSSKTKRRKSSKVHEISGIESETNESVPAKHSTRTSVKPDATEINAFTPSSATRSRKTSTASHEASSGAENEKINDDTNKSNKRRFSQRVSSSSEIKTENLNKPAESTPKSEPKRKLPSRR